MLCFYLGLTLSRTLTCYPQYLLPASCLPQGRKKTTYHSLHHLPVLVSLPVLQVVHQPHDLLLPPVLLEADDPDHGHCQVGGGVGGEGEAVATLCLVLRSLTVRTLSLHQ